MSEDTQPMKQYLPIRQHANQIHKLKKQFRLKVGDAIKLTLGDISECQRIGLPARYVEYTSDVPMAIITVNYPNTIITKEQADLLQKFILQEVDAITEGDRVPRFIEIKHNIDYVTVNCANLFSSEWLVKKVTGCECWKGARIQVVAENDMSQFVHTTVLLPGPITPIESIFNRFRIQNAGTITEKWKLIHSVVGTESQRLFITMDKLSWERLNKLNCFLYINFTRVRFYLIEEENWKTIEWDGMDKTEAWWEENIGEFVMKETQYGLQKSPKFPNKLHVRAIRTAGELIDQNRTSIEKRVKQFDGQLTEEEFTSPENLFAYSFKYIAKPLQLILEDHIKNMLPPDQLWTNFEHLKEKVIAGQEDYQEPIMPVNPSYVLDLKSVVDLTEGVEAEQENIQIIDLTEEQSKSTCKSIVDLTEAEGSPERSDHVVTNNIIRAQQVVPSKPPNLIPTVQPTQVKMSLPCSTQLKQSLNILYVESGDLMTQESIDALQAIISPTNQLVRPADVQSIHEMIPNKLTQNEVNLTSNPTLANSGEVMKQKSQEAIQPLVTPANQQVKPAGVPSKQAIAPTKVPPNKLNSTTNPNLVSAGVVTEAKPEGVMPAILTPAKQQVKPEGAPSKQVTTLNKANSTSNPNVVSAGEVSQQKPEGVMQAKVITPNKVIGEVTEQKPEGTMQAKVTTAKQQTKPAGVPTKQVITPNKVTPNKVISTSNPNLVSAGEVTEQKPEGTMQAKVTARKQQTKPAGALTKQLITPNKVISTSTPNLVSAGAVTKQKPEGGTQANVTPAKQPVKPACAPSKQVITPNTVNSTANPNMVSAAEVTKQKPEVDMQAKVTPAKQQVKPAGAASIQQTAPNKVTPNNVTLNKVNSASNPILVSAEEVTEQKPVGAMQAKVTPAKQHVKSAGALSNQVDTPNKVNSTANTNIVSAGEVTEQKPEGVMPTKVTPAKQQVKPAGAPPKQVITPNKVNSTANPNIVSSGEVTEQKPEGAIQVKVTPEKQQVKPTGAPPKLVITPNKVTANKVNSTANPNIVSAAVVTKQKAVGAMQAKVTPAKQQVNLAGVPSKQVITPNTLNSTSTPNLVSAGVGAKQKPGGASQCKLTPAKQQVKPVGAPSKQVITPNKVTPNKVNSTSNPKLVSAGEVTKQNTDGAMQAKVTPAKQQVKPTGAPSKQVNTLNKVTPNKVNSTSNPNLVSAEEVTEQKPVGALQARVTPAKQQVKPASEQTKQVPPQNKLTPNKANSTSNPNLVSPAALTKKAEDAMQPKVTPAKQQVKPAGVQTKQVVTQNKVVPKKSNLTSNPNLVNPGEVTKKAADALQPKLTPAKQQVKPAGVQPKQVATQSKVTPTKVNSTSNPSLENAGTVTKQKPENAMQPKVTPVKQQGKPVGLPSSQVNTPNKVAPNKVNSTSTPNLASAGQVTKQTSEGAMQVKVTSAKQQVKPVGVQTEQVVPRNKVTPNKTTSTSNPNLANSGEVMKKTQPKVTPTKQQVDPDGVHSEHASEEKHIAIKPEAVIKEGKGDSKTTTTVVPLEQPQKRTTRSAKRGLAEPSTSEKSLIGNPPRKSRRLSTSSSCTAEDTLLPAKTLKLKSIEQDVSKLNVVKQISEPVDLPIVKPLRKSRRLSATSSCTSEDAITPLPAKTKLKSIEESVPKSTVVKKIPETSPSSELLIRKSPRKSRRLSATSSCTSEDNITPLSTKTIELKCIEDDEAKPNVDKKKAETSPPGELPIGKPLRKSRRLSATSSCTSEDPITPLPAKTRMLKSIEEDVAKPNVVKKISKTSPSSELLIRKSPRKSRRLSATSCTSEDTITPLPAKTTNLKSIREDGANSDVVKKIAETSPSGDLLIGKRLRKSRRLSATSSCTSDDTITPLSTKTKKVKCNEEAVAMLNVEKKIVESSPSSELLIGKRLRKSRRLSAASSCTSDDNITPLPPKTTKLKSIEEDVAKPNVVKQISETSPSSELLIGKRSRKSRRLSATSSTTSEDAANEAFGTPSGKSRRIYARSDSTSEDSITPLPAKKIKLTAIEEDVGRPNVVKTDEFATPNVKRVGKRLTRPAKTKNSPTEEMVSPKRSKRAANSAAKCDNFVYY